MKTQVVLFTFLAIYVVHAAKHALGAESNLPEHWSIERIIARASEHTPEIKALIKDIERAIRLLAQTGERDFEEAFVKLAFGPSERSAT